MYARRATPIPYSEREASSTLISGNNAVSHKTDQDHLSAMATQHARALPLRWSHHAKQFAGRVIGQARKLLGSVGRRVQVRILWLIIPWMLLVGVSLGWNIYQAHQAREQLARETARSFFSQILITRRWSARHGGVYVPVTEDTQPNPYLTGPNRDLPISETLTLTLVNPAYMTRQLSEIAQEREGVQFHITSLKPMRPANRADAWESEALRSFEQDGVKETGEFLSSGDGLGYRYMAPLMTERICLDCHADQGYRVGEVRGGVSILLPSVGAIPLVTLCISHTVIALVGALLILWLGRTLSHFHARLREEADLDGLTSIPNRRFLNTNLSRLLARAQLEHKPLAVILCDVDHFKDYNDSLGHQAGDDCLRRVAQILTSGLRRDGDFCARYGGEEFMLVLPNTPLAGALNRAEAIRQAIEDQHIEHPATGGVLSISLGVAVADDTHPDHAALIEKADAALYRAKHRGRNRVEVAEDTAVSATPGAGEPA